MGTKWTKKWTKWTEGNGPNPNPNIRGHRTVPCGTPDFTGVAPDVSSLTVTLCCLDNTSKAHWTLLVSNNAGAYK